MRYIEGILSQHVLGYLKDGGFRASLEKLRVASKEHGHEHSLVDHHSSAVPVFTEAFLMQKVNYIHQNPVRACATGGGLPVAECPLLAGKAWGSGAAGCGRG